MSRMMRSPAPTLKRFPRVSGDEPTAVLGRGLTYQFSPRERG